MVIFEDDKRLFAVVRFLFMRQVIRRECFLLNQIPDIFLVPQNPDDVLRIPVLFGARLFAFLSKLLHDEAGTLLLVHVLVKNLPNDFRPGFIDPHHAVHHIIAQQRAAERNALFHSSRLSPLDALARFIALLLRDARHEG